MASSRRERALANPDVKDADYIESINRLCHGSTICDVLGPTLASGMHQITPNMIVRLSPMLEHLIKKGIRNGVVYPNRLDFALKASCTTLPKQLNPTVYFHNVTEHIRHALAVLRDLKREDTAGPRSGQKRSKVGSFRRACGMADTIIIKTLLDSMEVDPSPSPPPESSPLSSPRGSGDAKEKKIGVPIVDLPKATDLDENGYPLIFLKSSSILSKLQLSGRSADSRASSVGWGSVASLPSTTYYDEEGLPRLDDPRPDGEGPCESASEQVSKSGSNGSESDCVLDPAPKRRKAAAIAGKKKDKATVLPKAKAKAAPKRTPQKVRVEPKATPVKAKAAAKKAEGTNVGILCRPSMAGPTAEKDSRCELTAQEFQTDGSLKRVCVWSAKVRLWGPSLASDMRKMRAAIDGGGMTKQQCLDMRDRMK